MKKNIDSINGHCHCGNLSLDFRTELTPETLSLRACSCSFCAKHGARTTTDPRGQVEIRVGEPDLLVRYRFGERTADFLVCARCGVYVAAVMEAGGILFATLNANTFSCAPRLAQSATRMSYENEGREARMERRRQKWTPATMNVGS